MFFDSIAQIPEIAERVGFAIFATSQPIDAKIFGETALVISPNNKGKITVDMVREVVDFCRLKQTEATFIVITEAETMNEAAENAFLKLLEEPLENYHIVMLTREPSALLPTVLSRAKLYILKEKETLEQPIMASEAVKKYAKMLIASKSCDLPKVVKSITAEKEYKKSTAARGFALEITATAIEILYKSYFKTGNMVYLKKIPNFLELYNNLKQNGNIRLHLVADLC